MICALELTKEIEDHGKKSKTQSERIRPGPAHRRGKRRMK